MDDEKETENNVFRIVSNKDTQPETNELPVNTYRLIDINGYSEDWVGFLVFTSQHVAVMREQGSGAIPLAVMPLNMLHRAVIVE